jgi:Ca2+-binding EF-hand superfamily protein
MRRTYIPGHNNNRHLTTEELEHNIGNIEVAEQTLRERFDRADTNNSGYLERSELKKMIKEKTGDFGLPASDSEADRIISKYAAGENRVNFQQFSCIWLSLAQL